MNVHEAILKRESVRSYLDRDVEEDKLLRVLEAARLSPSAKNFQERRFIVVRDAAKRRLLMEAAKGQKFVGEAPVVIACCAVNTDYVMTCGQFAYSIDTAIAIDHMTLAAVEEGLGTCWIGAFYEEKVKEILGIPPGPEVRIVELLALGYPAKIRGDKSRLPLEEFVFEEAWPGSEQTGEA